MVHGVLCNVLIPSTEIFAPDGLELTDIDPVGSIFVSVVIGFVVEQVLDPPLLDAVRVTVYEPVFV